MRSEGAANRWSLNSRGGGSVTGVWEHAENSRHNPSTAEYLIWQIMRPAVSAVKQLLRIVVQHHGGRASESRGSVVPIERIESRILLVRGHKVLLDAALAALYGVQTRRLNEQERRKAARFPAAFMFQLTHAELELLMSQFATSKQRRGGPGTTPPALT